ncbi:MAG: N-acetyl-gamma-glutamyl-phosphate reductase [Planctomycetaceae bacterium]|jgi:N-acetyl-gamma-glutamyl-phosphate reductase|nr:N-acetyl-gamma-glutamyl-phosphate reductase [Planctomycetaceae bacterium]
MATTITILGATGYTALELIKILLRHPNTEITALTSREDTRSVELVHPSLSGRLNLSLENLSPKEIAAQSECVFSCLPHIASAKIVPELLSYGTRVIDLSADYRLSAADIFETWYAEKHPDPDRLGKVPYGLPELFRDQIVKTNLVANPGCYPTSAILPLVPLIKTGMIEPEDIIIDSKSGISGAGRKPKLTTLYPECNENISAYNIGTHRHTPEIEQIITAASGKKTTVLFTPHLTPMDRGILSTIYSKPIQPVTTNELLEILRDFYRDEPFVKIVEHLPSTKDVSGTNFVHITVRVVGNKVITVSAIDNLIKGASGAAVQNFNLMFNYLETTALI